MKNLIIILISLSFIFVSCKNTEKTKENNVNVIEEELKEPSLGEEKILGKSSEVEPIWMSSIYKIKDKFPKYELFLGISNYAKNEQEAKKSAEQDAIQKATNYLGTYSETSLKRTLKLSQGINLEIIKKSNEEIIQRSQGFLKNIKTLETFVVRGKRYNKYQVWENFVKTYVLFAMKKEELQMIKSEIKEIQKEQIKSKSRMENSDISLLFEEAIKELDSIK